MANTYVPDEALLVSPSEEEVRRGFALGVCIADLFEQDVELFSGQRLHPVAVMAGLFHFINEQTKTDPAYARDLAFTAQNLAATLREMVEREVGAAQ